MNAYFIDTSALAKRYVPETGSAWVLSWILPNFGNTIVIAELAVVEFFGLLSRRQRQGSLALSNANALRDVFLLHVQQEYLVVPLDSSIITRARQLVTHYPLRTLDAIQLACALQAASLLETSLTFVCSDRNLLTAARAEGFATADPNSFV